MTTNREFDCLTMLMIEGKITAELIVKTPWGLRKREQLTAAQHNVLVRRPRNAKNIRYTVTEKFNNTLTPIFSSPQEFF